MNVTAELLILLVSFVGASAPTLSKEEEETLYSCYNLATSGAAKRQPVEEDINRFLDAYLAAHPEDKYQPVLTLVHDALDDEYVVKTALREETTLKGPNIYAIGKKVKARLEETAEEGDKQPVGQKKQQQRKLGKDTKEVTSPLRTETTEGSTTGRSSETSNQVVSTLVLVLGPLSGAAIILVGSILFYLLHLKPRLDSKSSSTIVNSSTNQ